MFVAVVACPGAFFTVPVPVGAQPREEPDTLVADRPGLGDGAHVIGEGVVQAELGMQIEAVVNDEYLAGTSVLRMGLSALELRFTIPSLLLLNQGRFLQLGDLGVGAKVPLGAAWGGWDWAAIGGLTFATGSERVTAGETTASGMLIAERAVTKGMGLALNAGYAFPFDGVGDGTLALIATPVFAVPGREGMAFYLGYGGFFTKGDDTHFIEWGLTRLDGPDRQWDLNAGYDPGGHNWFLGVGVTQRRR